MCVFECKMRCVMRRGRDSAAAGRVYLDSVVEVELTESADSVRLVLTRSL